MPGWCPCLYVWYRLPRPCLVVDVEITTERPKLHTRLGLPKITANEMKATLEAGLENVQAIIKMASKSDCYKHISVKRLQDMATHGLIIPPDNPRYLTCRWHIKKDVIHSGLVLEYRKIILTKSTEGFTVNGGARMPLDLVAFGCHFSYPLKVASPSATNGYKCVCQPTPADKSPKDRRDNR